MTADVRARAIEAGARALEEYGLGLYGSEQRAIAAAVVDAVDPIIRADERARWRFVGEFEAEVRERIAQEIVGMDPGELLGYSHHPDTRLTGVVIQRVADRICGSQRRRAVWP